MSYWDIQVQMTGKLYSKDAALELKGEKEDEDGVWE